MKVEVAVLGSPVPDGACGRKGTLKQKKISRTQAEGNIETEKKKKKKGLAVKLYIGKQKDFGSNDSAASALMSLQKLWSCEFVQSLIKMALITAHLTTEFILVTLFSH